MHREILSDQQRELLPFVSQLFSDKQFRLQLAFHKDIDYSESVEYISDFEVDEQVVKDFLIDKSLQEI